MRWGGWVTLPVDVDGWLRMRVSHEFGRVIAARATTMCQKPPPANDCFGVPFLKSKRSSSAGRLQRLVARTRVAVHLILTVNNIYKGFQVGRDILYVYFVDGLRTKNHLVTKKPTI